MKTPVKVKFVEVKETKTNILFTITRFCAKLGYMPKYENIF